jgi:hypothetical protein
MHGSEAEVLTSGERTAAAAGKDITTREQFAVCYAFQQGFERDLKGICGSDNFPLECGMKVETFRRATEKFGVMVAGLDLVEEVTNREAIYPKIREAYRELSVLDKDALLRLASAAFTQDNKSRGKAYYEDYLLKQQNMAKQQRDNKRMLEINIRQFVNDVVRSLNKGDLKEAKAKALKMASNKYNIKVRELQKLLK